MAQIFLIFNQLPISQLVLGDVVPD
jgi:hypothetical protein